MGDASQRPDWKIVRDTRVESCGGNGNPYMESPTWKDVNMAVNTNKRLQIVLSVILFGLLIYFTEPWKIIPQLAHHAPLMILVLVLGFLSVIFLNAVVGWWLINGFTFLPFSKALKYYLYSWSTEYFLPGKLGAFSIVYFLKKENIPIKSGLAVVVLTKSLTLFLLLLLAADRLIQLIGNAQLTLYLLLVFVMGGGIIVLFSTPGGRNFIKTHVLGKYAIHFSGFAGTLKQLFQQPLRIIGALVLLLAVISVNASTMFFLFQQAGYAIPFFSVLTAVSVALLSGLIPITFNGLGIKEGILVILLSSTTGIPPNVVLVLSTLSTLVGFVMSLLVSWFVIQNLPLDKIREWIQEQHNPS